MARLRWWRGAVKDLLENADTEALGIRLKDTPSIIKSKQLLFILIRFPLASQVDADAMADGSETMNFASNQKMSKGTSNKNDKKKLVGSICQSKLNFAHHRDRPSQCTLKLA
jgi:hypothetical protein